MKIFIAFFCLIIALSTSNAFARLGAHDQSLRQPLQESKAAQLHKKRNITTTTYTPYCDFKISVKTGAAKDAGTDAMVFLWLFNADSQLMAISDLGSFGDMGPDHDYFERGGLDVFSGDGPCLPDGPCTMELFTDGSGDKPGWYVSYVEVTQIGHLPGSPTYHHKFTVDQWLSLDEPPYELVAERYDCGNHAVMGAA